MKTLDQVEARIPIDATHTPGDMNSEFVISKPGSYFLTGNLNTSKTNGIYITVANVTVDLNGFRLAGGSGSAIKFEAAATDCTIKNGLITGWGRGIDGVDKGSISHVTVSNCSGDGIVVGTDWLIEGCLSHDNTRGISTGSGSRIINCGSSHNSDDGIDTLSNSVLVNCTASGNTGHAGISTGSNCSISHCSAGSNLSATSTSSGFLTGDGCTITACSAMNNFSTFGTAGGSTGAGFIINGNSVVQNCAAEGNKGDGINVKSSGNCLIIGNSCSINGLGGDGAGIHILGSGCRIEGNNVTNNDRGIEVGFAGNLIIKNSARVNGIGSAGNYVIAADNRYGPIIDDTAAGSIAASGKGPFTSTLTTTDPWANFSY
jgi:parallel beta-helix repeat protein